MKAVVIYKSKTGYVKKYAGWIAEELLADVLELSTVNIDRLAGYDIIIYGGSLHAVGIIGINFITGNFDKLKDKKLVVFASGASPFSEEIVEEIIKNNIPEKQRNQVKLFYLRGGFNFNKLPLTDKVLMTLLKWKLNRKKKQGKTLTGDEKGMLAAYDKPVDFTKKKNIADLINYIDQLHIT